MPSVIYSPSPKALPKSYSRSPMYSERPRSNSPIPIPPSNTQMPSYRPHIMPMQNADMIPSPIMQVPVHSHSLIIGSLQAIGFVAIVFILIIIWSIRFENAKAKARAKAKHMGFFHSDYFVQQINPTAYNKLNLIRRSSSNSLSSGNISPI